MAVRRAASAKRLLLCGGEKGGLGEAAPLLVGGKEGGFGEAASYVAVRRAASAVRTAASAKRLLQMWQ